MNCSQVVWGKARKILNVQAFYHYLNFLLWFVCSMVGLLLCLTNWIHICRVPQYTNGTQVHWMDWAHFHQTPSMIIVMSVQDVKLGNPRRYFFAPCSVPDWLLIGFYQNIWPPLTYCLPCVVCCWAREPNCAAISTWDRLSQIPLPLFPWTVSPVRS